MTACPSPLTDDHREGSGAAGAGPPSAELDVTGAPARPPRADRAARLRSRLATSGMTSQQLWLEHLRIGADLGPGQVDAALAGDLELSDHEYAVLDQTLFEVLLGSPPGQAPLRPGSGEVAPA